MSRSLLVKLHLFPRQKVELMSRDNMNGPVVNSHSSGV